MMDDNFSLKLLQSWDQFLVGLDIVGTVANAKDWVVGTVQAIIEFGLVCLERKRLTLVTDLLVCNEKGRYRF